MKANNITIEQITAQLTIVLNDTAKLRTYHNDREQYTMFAGWTGAMNAPESRPAYVRAFGESTVQAAEEAAHDTLNNWYDAYQASDWATYKAQADEYEETGAPVPSALAHVWGECSHITCDGGRGYMDEMENRTMYCDNDPHPSMLQVKQVINVTPDELNRPQLADELAKAQRLPGGAWIEEDNNLQAVAPYHLSCVEVAMVTDGKRYYYIDAEGYDYARYIYLPTNWREMFADELQTLTNHEESATA